MKFSLSFNRIPSNVDQYSSRFSVYYHIHGSKYLLCCIHTAVSHCCGMNSIQQFEYGWLDTIKTEDWNEVFELLKGARAKYELPWNIVDLIFFVGEDEKRLLKSLIEHPYTKPVMDFPSRSGYGKWEHPVSQYHVAIPMEHPEDE